MPKQASRTTRNLSCVGFAFQIRRKCGYANPLRINSPATATGTLAIRGRAGRDDTAHHVGTTGTKPAQDLPLLSTLADFDALLDRLCDLFRYPADMREEMRQARRRMAPGNVPAELDAMRELVNSIEAVNHRSIAERR